MHLLRLLLAGWQLLFGRQPRINRLPLTAGWFWLLAAVSLLTELAFDFAAILPPRLFELNALQSWTIFTLLILLIGMLSARWCKQPALIWQLPVLLISADIIRSLLLIPVYAWLIRAPEAYWPAYLWLWYATLIWLAVPVFIGLRTLQPWQFRRRQLLPAISYSIGAYLLATQLTLVDFWQTDYSSYYQDVEAAEEIPSFDIEKTLYRQPEMIDRLLADLAPQRPGHTDMYFVQVAAFGEQDVFMQETMFVEQLLIDRFAADDRQITLINNPAVIDQYPLASVTNLQATLNGLARIMDPDEDILFLFLTSHGSENHWMSFSLYNVPLSNLSADYLGTLLKQSGIQFKVVVVSACFSGGFIEPLQDEHSLIITAARADRHSFGCGDDSDMTYFGRAFFEFGLNSTRSFSEAFEIAAQHVSEWEQRDGFTASEPQISSNPQIISKLQDWTSTLQAAD